MSPSTPVTFVACQTCCRTFIDAQPTARGGAASRHHNGLRDAGDADAVVGFDHRQCRPAVYAGQSVGELRSDYLGADIVYHRGGDHDGSGGLAVGAVWFEAAVSDLDDRVYRRIDAVRDRRDFAGDGRLPAAAR